MNSERKADKSNKYTTLIYDLDGTLLDTLADLMNSVNYALDLYGYPHRNLDEIRRFIGNGVAVLMRRSAPKDCPQDKVDRMLDIFRPYYMEHMYDNTRPYEGVLSMMETVHLLGYKSAIVSNKLDAAVKELDKRYFHGLTELALGTPKDAKKPDPTGVFMALERLGSSKDESIYIGDTDIDIETAHNAGLKCIGVSWGFRGRQFLEDNKCDYIIDTPEELAKLLKEL